MTTKCYFLGWSRDPSGVYFVRVSADPYSKMQTPLSVLLASLEHEESRAAYVPITITDDPIETIIESFIVEVEKREAKDGFPVNPNNTLRQVYEEWKGRG